MAGDKLKSEEAQALLGLNPYSLLDVSPIAKALSGLLEGVQRCEAGLSSLQGLGPALDALTERVVQLELRPESVPSPKLAVSSRASELEPKLDALAARVVELESAVAPVQELSSQLDALQERVAPVEGLSTQLEVLTDRVAEQGHALPALKAANQRLTDRVAELEADATRESFLEGLSGRVSQLESGAKGQERSGTELASRLDGLADRMAEQGQNIATLKPTIERLQDKAQDQDDHLKPALAKLEKRLGDQEQKQELVDRDVQRILPAQDKADSRMAGLEKEVAELQGSSRAMNPMLNQLSTRQSEQEKALAALTATADDQEKGLTGMQKDLKELRPDVKMLVTQMEHQVAAADTNARELNEMRLRVEDNEREIKRKNAELEQLGADLTARYENSVASSRRQFEEVQDRTDLLRKAVTDMEQKWSETEAKTRTELGKAAEIVARGEQLSGDAVRVSQEALLRSNEAVDLLTTVQSSATSCQEQLVGVHRYIEALRSKQEKLDQAMTKHQDSVRGYRDAVAEMRDQAKLTEANVVGQVRELNKVTAALSSELHRRQAGIEQRLEVLEVQVSGTGQELTGLTRRVDQLVELKQDIVDIQSNVDEAVSRLQQDLENTVDQETYHKLLRDFEKAVQRVRELERGHAEVQKSVLETASGLTAAFRRTEAIQKEMEQLSIELGEQKRDASDANDNFAARIDAYHTDHRKSTSRTLAAIRRRFGSLWLNLSPTADPRSGVASLLRRYWRKMLLVSEQQRKARRVRLQMVVLRPNEWIRRRYLDKVRTWCARQRQERARELKYTALRGTTGTMLRAVYHRKCLLLVQRRQRLGRMKRLASELLKSSESGVRRVYLHKAALVVRERAAKEEAAKRAARRALHTRAVGALLSTSQEGIRRVYHRKSVDWVQQRLAMSRRRRAQLAGVNLLEQNSHRRLLLRAYLMLQEQGRRAAANAEKDVYQSMLEFLRGDDGHAALLRRRLDVLAGRVDELSDRVEGKEVLDKDKVRVDHQSIDVLRDALQSCSERIESQEKKLAEVAGDRDKAARDEEESQQRERERAQEREKERDREHRRDRDRERERELEEKEREQRERERRWEKEREREQQERDKERERERSLREQQQHRPPQRKPPHEEVIAGARWVPQDNVRPPSDHRPTEYVRTPEVHGGVGQPPPMAGPTAVQRGLSPQRRAPPVRNNNLSSPPAEDPADAEAARWRVLHAERSRLERLDSALPSRARAPGLRTMPPPPESPPQLVGTPTPVVQHGLAGPHVQRAGTPPAGVHRVATP
eukprot:Hpha_TRINITY_DN16731_c1_g5::TRINITY_DN16731_c1_g5_i1::g.78061::m.78061